MKKFQKVVAMLLCIGMMASLLTACGGATEKTAGDGEMANIKWYISSAQPQGFDEVMVEANKYLGEKYNMQLDLQCIESGDYESKMQLALASGEEFDLIWTSNWKFDYESNAAKGAFLELDDMLKNDVPELYEYYSEGIWGAATVGDKIYGVPMEQVLYNQKGIQFKKSYLDKYGFTDYYNQVNGWEDLEEIYDVIAEGEKGDPTFAITTSTQKDYFIPEVTQITGDYTVGATFIVDGKVTDRAEEYDDYRRRMRVWNQKGYFPAGIATAETDNIVTLGGYTRYLPGCEGKAAISAKEPVIAIPTTEPFLGRNGVQSTLTAVSATSSDPVAALKLLHIMHTDEYMLNLICYGIEGRDYTKDPENPKRMDRESGSYYIAEFMIGSQFLAYLVPTYEDGVWEETKAGNEAATVDPNIEFSFDPKDVESQISQVAAVAAEYKTIFEYGLMDAEIAISEYNEKINKAGFKEVQTEIQRQYDAWLAEQE